MQSLSSWENMPCFRGELTLLRVLRCLLISICIQSEFQWFVVPNLYCNQWNLQLETATFSSLPCCNAPAIVVNIGCGLSGCRTGARSEMGALAISVYAPHGSPWAIIFLTCGSRSTNIWKKTPKWWFMSFQMTLSCRISPAILILAHSQFLEKLPIFCWHYGYFHHTRLFSQFMDCKKNVRKPRPPVECDYSQLTSSHV